MNVADDHLDRASLCELKRILEKIEQNLHNSLYVCVDYQRHTCIIFKLETDSFLFSAQPEQVLQLLECVPNIDVQVVLDELPVLDLENV
jgi:hypothetical protein